MAAEYALVCDETDFDAVAGTCSTAHYELAPTGLPALSIAEAQAIGTKMALVFALAWCFRRVRKIAV
jgi:hypothetical protein